MWKKVVAPTALVSLLWVVVSCGTSYMLAQIDESQTRALYSNRYVIQAAGGMQENLWRMQAVMLEASEHSDRGETIQHDFAAEAREAEEGFTKELTRANDNASTGHERALVRDIRERFAQYGAYSRERLASDRDATRKAAGPIERAMSLARAVAQPCEDLSALAHRVTNDTFQRRDRLRARVDALRITFIIVGPAVGILLGLWVARRLHRSISQISVTLRDASGELEQEIGLVEVHPLDETNSLPALQQQVENVSSHIKQVVEELQRARREALRAERLAAVGELAAGVAHEVRNPLTSVKLLIQAVARNQTSGSTDQERLSIVQQEIARIETIIQELLDYARPPKLHRVRHDVRDTLRRALNLVEGRSRQNNVVIHEQLGAEPMIVDADPEQLDQVFINLLLNAIEAMSAGGTLQVTVEGDCVSASRLLRIMFHDSGGGIPDEVMQRIFEPFVTSKERGIGLGLAISRRIMQEHGGRLTAYNSASGGATFVVEVPLAAAAPPGAESDEASGATWSLQISEEVGARKSEVVSH
jgi:two-component system, NtrC family, sensor histidine kinase HydH